MKSIPSKTYKTADNPLLIAGPCSAETRGQILSTAEALKHLNIDYFRAGVWKPRTRPNSFEGVGQIGLDWLKEVKQKYQMKCCVEVATPGHVEQAIKAGIDAVWLGSRTTTNPFSVQEIAESLRGANIPVWIKNPMNADLSLWIGAIERISQVGIEHISAIHRGFSHYGPSMYRNEPIWEIPRQLKREIPDMDIIHDPSHIAGNRDLVPSLIGEALEENMNGLMVECHPNPREAWTDADQQISTSEMANIVTNIRAKKLEDLNDSALINWRNQINHLDESLILLLEQRHQLALKIGAKKQKNGDRIYQEERWKFLLNRTIDLAKKRNLKEHYIAQLFEIIHQESIRLQQEDRQETILNV